MMGVLVKNIVIFAIALCSVTGSVVSRDVVSDDSENMVQIGERVGMFNEYYVYSRANFRNPTQVLVTNESISDSDILATRDTVIIVHGADASATTSLNLPLKDAYLSVQDYNIIVVDWSIFANQGYASASASVPRIAAGLAELIELVVEAEAVSYDTLHLVGFGLGAHVVGIAGRSVSGTVARITGLDPAGTGWDLNSLRLRSTDADYVEVIHTDGFGTRANGIGEPIGHVDFFPNGGGTNQPGCSNNLCSHNRAWELFESSILSDHLVGARCDTLALMTSNRCVGPQLRLGGNDYVKWGSGIYRLATARVFPY